MLIVVSVAFGQQTSAPKQGPPPKNLTKGADGHLSANHDPANPEKFEVYAVKAGDTLSIISGQVLKNPMLWPQLWEQNDHIVNPHWIYPNDKILIRPVTPITQAVPPPAPEPAKAPEPEPPPPAAPATVVASAPQPPPTIREEPVITGTFDLSLPKAAPEIKAADVYCSGFIRTPEVVTRLKVTAKFDSGGGALATLDDYVYLNQGGEDGIRSGDRFDVLRMTRKVAGTKGATKAERELGTHYLNIGQIQVIMTQPDTAMAKVISQCETVEIGDIMIPPRQLEIPSPPRPRSFSPTMKAAGGISGSILMSLNILTNYGAGMGKGGGIPGANFGALKSLANAVVANGSIVYVDIGRGSGVKVGDVFIAYRTGGDVSVYNTPAENRKLATERSAVGEIVIIRVEERTATAIVTYSKSELLTGDSVVKR